MNKKQRRHSPHFVLLLVGSLGFIAWFNQAATVCGFAFQRPEIGIEQIAEITPEEREMKRLNYPVSNISLAQGLMHNVRA